jgi:hypothetical protein
MAIMNELFRADHKHNDRCRMKYLHMLKITLMATIRKFEVIPDNFNVIRTVLVDTVHRNGLLNIIIITY